ncbi:hypothetical protein DV736_g5043, partial [Chaetothyriales sp. CBS 134916]
MSTPSRRKSASANAPLGRTTTLIETLQYSTILHLAAFGLYAYVFFLPGTLQLLTLLSPINFKSLENLPDKRHFRLLYICVVTRGTNVATVRRGAEHMAGLLSIDARLRFVILTEEQAVPHFADLYGVELVGVPVEYRPSKARFKARSLEYFRTEKAIRNDDWVLHLDEETLVDEHATQSCISFIQKEVTHDYGQGCLLYNSVNYWDNALLTYADLGRARDDFGRFQFAHNVLHFPINGVHGSFLLIRGIVENTVGWNTESFVEDFWFTDWLQAWKLGFSGGFIPSFAREQSCSTIPDFLRQRRRWTCGIWNLSGGFRATGLIGKCICWLNGNLDTFPMETTACSPLPFWLYAYICFYHGASQASLAISCVLQDVDARVSLLRICQHVALLPFYSVGTGALHLAALGYSIIDPAKSFDIVRKA